MFQRLREHRSRSEAATPSSTTTVSRLLLETNTDMNQPRPLPRSLDPLPDESLPGYLLRQAHRLDLTPARVILLTMSSTGLQHACRSSHELMVKLGPATRERFRTTTRLTMAEVDGLTLGSLGGRFPIPAEPTNSKRFGDLAANREWWLFTSATRYCPDCLAGDGSDIQQAHGGGWRRSWRLPITFACVEHRRLLRHVCPNCRRPAHGTLRNGGRIPLIAGSRIHGLHPVQCRWTPAETRQNAVAECGARLDSDASDTIALLSDNAFALQQRLRNAVDPDGTATMTTVGEPTTPTRYITDLRILSQLIQSHWRWARICLPATEFNDAVDAHLDWQPRRYNDSAADLAETRRPLNPAVAAGLLTAADHILSKDNPADAGALLREVLPSKKKSRLRWARHAVDGCSPGLRQAIEPALRTYTKVRSTARPGDLQTAFGPEHIPQWLPDDIFDRYLSHFTGISHSSLRRFSAVRLLQLAFGGSLGDAAQYLGIRVKTDTNGKNVLETAHTIKTWVNNLDDPNDLDRAISNIATHLDQHEQRINYQRRRATLTDWAISTSQWHQLVALCAPRATAMHRDYDRNFASTIVWSKVTSSERRYAPAGISGQAPTTRRRARPAPAWAYRRTIRAPSEASVDLALDSLAKQLATTIDQGLPLMVTNILKK
ncbi:TniQ family protein [Nocardia gipuzkoensis]